MATGCGLAVPAGSTSTPPIEVSGKSSPTTPIPRQRIASSLRDSAAEASAPGLGERLRELPDVTTWIGEAGRADSPWSIHRAIQQFHSAGFQLGARCVYVMHRDGELEARPGPRTRHHTRLDQIACGRDLEEVDQGVLKSEHCGILVFEVD